MEMPAILQGESLTRLLQGTAMGAVATIVIGFGWGGWTLESAAAKRTAESTKNAVVMVLAPICADKFQRAADAEDTLKAFKKESTYQQASFVEKGGWAVLPGSDKASDGVARACAKILGELK